MPPQPTESELPSQHLLKPIQDAVPESVIPHDLHWCHFEPHAQRNHQIVELSPLTMMSTCYQYIHTTRRKRWGISLCWIRFGHWFVIVGRNDQAHKCAVQRRFVGPQWGLMWVWGCSLLNIISPPPLLASVSSLVESYYVHLYVW